MSVSFSLLQHEQALDAESRYWSCYSVLRASLSIPLGVEFDMAKWLRDEYLAPRFSMEVLHRLDMDIDDLQQLTATHEAFIRLMRWHRTGDREERDFLKTLRGLRKDYVELFRQTQW